jgi:hypothetical protein
LSRVADSAVISQRKANLRLALILATVAIVFGVGFAAKIVFFGR